MIQSIPSSLWVQSLIQSLKVGSEAYIECKDLPTAKLAAAKARVSASNGGLSCSTDAITMHDERVMLRVKVSSKK